MPQLCDDDGRSAGAAGVAAGVPRCSRVAMEATAVYWQPVWKISSDGNFELIVANAAHIKTVPGRKTDMNDARRSPRRLRLLAMTRTNLVKICF
jgi:transposase